MAVSFCFMFIFWSCDKFSFSFFGMMGGCVCHPLDPSVAVSVCHTLWSAWAVQGQGVVLNIFSNSLVIFLKCNFFFKKIFYHFSFHPLHALLRNVRIYLCVRVLFIRCLFSTFFLCPSSWKIIQMIVHHQRGLNVKASEKKKNYVPVT